MTREQKIAKARKLRDEGQGYTAIGRKLGVNHGTVWKWLHPEAAREFARRQEAKPERKAAKKAWACDPANRVPCETCGKPTGHTPGQSQATSGRGRCRACQRAEEAERVAERARRIERWWAEGLTLNEIAAELGWSVGHIKQEMDRLRVKGFYLPYRRQLKNPKIKRLAA